MKKHHSGIISIQTGMRLAEKEKNILVPNSVAPRPWIKNSQKKIAKKFKKLKNIIPALSLSKPG